MKSMKSMKSIGRSDIGLKNRLSSSAPSQQAQIILQQSYRNLPDCQLWNCTDSTVTWNQTLLSATLCHPLCTVTDHPLHFHLVLFWLYVCIRYQRKSDAKDFDLKLFGVLFCKFFNVAKNLDFLIPKPNIKSFLFASYWNFLQTLKPNALKKL